MTNLEWWLIVLAGVAIWLAARPVIRKGRAVREKETAQLLLHSAEKLQAASDGEIVSDYADMLAKGDKPMGVFFDEALLPHPKETILSAIEREIVREADLPRVELLKSCAVFLADFRQGVGRKSIPYGGFDIKAINAATSDPTEQIRMVANSPDIEKAKKLGEDSQKEMVQIMRRVDAACRLREARGAAR